DGEEGYLERGKIAAQRFGQEHFKQRNIVDYVWRAHAPKGRDAAAQLARDPLEEARTVAKQFIKVRADLRRRQAGRVGRTADRAHGGTGNDGRLDAEFIEGLEDDHVGKPAGRAAAERQADAWSRFPPTRFRRWLHHRRRPRVSALSFARRGLRAAVCGG